MNWEEYNLDWKLQRGKNMHSSVKKSYHVNKVLVFQTKQICLFLVIH